MIGDRLALVALDVDGGSVFPRRLDRGDVRVDEHDLDALLLEGLDGLRACVARARLERRGDGVRAASLAAAATASWRRRAPDDVASTSTPSTRRKTKARSEGHGTPPRT